MMKKVVDFPTFFINKKLRTAYVFKIYYIN